MAVRVGPQRRLSTKELMLSNCVCLWRFFPLDSKEIKSVNPKGNQSWIFNGRTNAEALILCPPDEKSQLTGKGPGAGKDWGQAKKGVTEDEMVGWHHWFNGHEFEQTPGDDEGQGNLLCYSLWGHKEPDMTEWLNNNCQCKEYGFNSWSGKIPHAMEQLSL